MDGFVPQPGNVAAGAGEDAPLHRWAQLPQMQHQAALTLPSSL